MKLKKLFALALAVCMVLSAAPVSMAGILSNGSSNGSSTGGILSSGSSNGSTTGGSLSSSTPTQLSNTGALQNSILSNSSSAQPLDDGTGETVEEPVVDNSGALDDGETADESSTAIHTKLENNSSVSGSASLVTDEGNKLELSKKVSDDGDKITLEAYVTGKQVTSSVSSAAPMDVILILDTSREMGDKVYTYKAYTGGKSSSNLRSQAASATGLFFKDTSGNYYPVKSQLTGWWLVGWEHQFYYVDSSGVRHDLEKIRGGIGAGQSSDQYYKNYYVIDQTTYTANAAKLQDLKTAANAFIDLLAAGDTNYRRVALLTYNDTTRIWSGTGTAVDGALVNAKDNATTLKTAINGISIDTNKAAYCDTALNAAKQIFQNGNATVPVNRPRVVILLSAGVFGPSGTLSNSSTDGYTAMDMIWLSTILKADRVDSNNQIVNASVDFSSDFYGYSDNGNNSGAAFKTKYGANFNGCGADIYCVGIGMPNTDESVNENGRLTDAGTESSLAARINEVMYRVSSHRPDGTHVNYSNASSMYNSWETVYNDDGRLQDWSYHYWDTFTRNRPNGYFLTVNNTDDLSDIFETISEDIITGGSGNSTLTTATEIKDAVSDYFVIPQNDEGTYSITVSTAKYKGNDDSNITASDWNDPVVFADAIVDCNGKTVTVRNFSFTDNWVGSSSGSPHGYKLIIEIPIAPKTGFLGGQGIPTNDDANAGVYLDGTLVENFPSTDAKTKVEIPDITVDVKGKNVYYSNALTDAEMLADAKVMIGEVELDLTKKNFGLAEWQYAYLSKIEIVTLEDADAFNATCTVTDKASGTKSGTDATPAQITVFKPHISFKDSTIYLGEMANYANNNGDPLVVWKDAQNNVAVPANMTGTRPSVKVYYSIEEQNDLYFTDCTDIKITDVELNGVVKDAYLGATRFWNGDTETTGNDQFKVHVLYPSVSYDASTVQLGYAPDKTYYKTHNLVKTGEGKTIVTWADQHDDHGISSVTNNDDGSFTYSFTPEDTSLTDCTSVEAAIAIKVNKVDVTADTDVFTVHVVRPTITFADQVIHLSKQPDYIDLSDTDEAKAFAWDSGCAWAHTDIPAVTGAVDVANFELAYSVAETATFLDCTDVDVTVLFGEDDYTSYVTLKNGTDTRGKDLAEFTVHVLKPDFTVAVTDLHADYGTPVGLDHKIEDQTVQAVNCSYAWKCATADCDDVKTVSNLTGESVAIGQVLYSITCDPADAEALTKDGETNQWTYLVNETDTTFTVELVGFKIGSDVYDESTHRAGVTFTNEDSEFVIYTNKFDLTINKEWKDGEKAADGTYKQDAIFTVAHGQDTFKVVLPAGQSNVKVTGLLCGQTYTVSEDNAWTWRWSSKDAEQEFTGASHDVSAEDPHRKMTDAKHVEEVSFTNNLFNRFWLSFCTFIANIFQKGGN